LAESVGPVLEAIICAVMDKSRAKMRRKLACSRSTKAAHVSNKEMLLVRRIMIVSLRLIDRLCRRLMGGSRRAAREHGAAIKKVVGPYRCLLRANKERLR